MGMATFPDSPPSSTHYPLGTFGAWILSPLVFNLGPPVYWSCICHWCSLLSFRWGDCMMSGARYWRTSR